MDEKEPRTTQEAHPHLALVHVRNSIETHCGLDRAAAAQIANCLTHQQCDDVIDAGEDEKKVRSVAVGGHDRTEEKITSVSRRPKKMEKTPKKG